MNRLCLLLVVLAPISAPAQVVAVFEDDAADATGPGSYRKPGDSDIVDGDFDLRRFEVRLDGDDVLFKVTLAAPFRQPAVTARGTLTPIDLWNGIYLQNLDIYIDQDRAPGSGYATCIPGRRVGFAAGRTWEVAVVLTPQPGPARSIVEGALGEAGKHVLFPGPLQTQGRTVIARVPAAALGGKPQKTWGYSVHVSGARWERSFSLVERVARGTPAADAFTMPVVGVGEAWAFGGAPEGNFHPRVVDVLLPRGTRQEPILASFDALTGSFARVPFVDSVASPVPAAPPPVAALTIVDVSDATVTLGGPVDGIAALMIGRVLDATGATVARIVVVRLIEGGLIAEVVEGAARVTRGSPVRFDAVK